MKDGSELEKLIDEAISNADIETLEQIKRKIEEEIQRKKNGNKVKVVFETDGWFDARKHGNAYVSIITKDDNGKIKRDFIPWTQRVWDSKHKFYKARWELYLPIGTKIEARLSDGSWKNDRKSYFIITKEGAKEVERKEVLGL